MDKNDSYFVRTDYKNTLRRDKNDWYKDLLVLIVVRSRQHRDAHVFSDMTNIQKKCTSTNFCCMQRKRCIYISRKMKKKTWQSANVYRFVFWVTSRFLQLMKEDGSVSDHGSANRRICRQSKFQRCPRGK